MTFSHHTCLQHPRLDLPFHETIKEKGHEIVKKGDIGNSMFVVGEGEAAVYVDGNKVKSYKAGVCKDAKRTASVVVVRQSAFVRISLLEMYLSQ